MKVKFYKVSDIDLNDLSFFPNTKTSKWWLTGKVISGGEEHDLIKLHHLWSDEEGKFKNDWVLEVDDYLMVGTEDVRIISESLYKDIID